MKHYSNGHMTANDYLMMYLARWKRVAVVLLVIWIVVTLRGNLKDLDAGLFLDSGQGPSEEYENLRRRIQSNTKELWYYINHELNKVIFDEKKSDRLQTGWLPRMEKARSGQRQRSNTAEVVSSPEPRELQGCEKVYCLIFAYATERTLILNSKGWRYNTKGWDYVFYPISETCTSSYDDQVLQWAEEL
ncbi:hypothetical protein MSG28_004522 [Choristoneura fumiferana]|uniref:Uncharacterized protein n=1 Tax=Choristoneura fumiferana TaxID=7141 RepID=A0ACC0K6Y1_CHOFU|nr:hypothetical protein MSG28_004522 [Choristoneura fumiferana]